MDWKTFFILCGGIVFLVVVLHFIYEAGKAEIYKELYERNKEIVDKLLEIKK